MRATSVRRTLRGQADEEALALRRCDPKYLYPFALLLLTLGVIAALVWRDPVHLNRARHFIIGTGVWMSLRYTLREGITIHKDAADSSPVFPGTNQVNPAYFSELAFEIGEARLPDHSCSTIAGGSR